MNTQMKLVNSANLEPTQSKSIFSSVPPDIPVDLRSVKTSPSARSKTPGSSGQSVQAYPLVLVVDDDPMIRFLAQQALENRSFRVLLAEDGQQALELFNANLPDLILCDVMMPQLSGFELCEQIRSSKRGKHVPVVMLTGLNDARSIQQAFSVGATDFCEKPMNWELLPYKLNYVLRASLTFSELQISEERYSLLSRGANDGIWDWDYKNDQIYFSPRWITMLGYKDDSIGSDPLEWIDRIHPEDKRHVISELHAHKNAKTSHFECEYRIKNALGEYRWMMCRGLAVRDDAGLAYRMIGSQTDVTSQKKAEELLVHDSIHDPLTGLANEVLLLNRLGHCIDLVNRRKSGRFAVIYVNLNQINRQSDGPVQPFDDQLIVKIAARIKPFIRKTDTFARLSGESFAILCEDIHDLTTATKLSDCISKELHRAFEIDGDQVAIACSIGITDSSLSYQSPGDMLRDANAAMYRSEASEGYKCEIFDLTMQQQATKALQIETDLRKAFEANEFEVHYQPIIKIENRTISGFEALVRWNHPTLGLLFPADFLRVAEDSRLVVPLGRWVLAQACQQMQNWKNRWPEAEDWTISVNLSSIELAQSGMVELVREIVKQSGLKPDYLKFEINESQLISCGQHALKTIHNLRQQGVHLSIDNFGLGGISFNHLHQLPFDELKIDRQFVSGLDERSNKDQIVTAIVSLAHSLEMNVVGMGSSSAAILQNLRGFSSQYAEGFSIMEPKRAEDVIPSILVEEDQSELN